MCIRTPQPLPEGPTFGGALGEGLRGRTEMLRIGLQPAFGRPEGRFEVSPVWKTAKTRPKSAFLIQPSFLGIRSL